MPVADGWIAHGRAKARIEVVECFLSVGVTWEVIEAASGLTETGLQALKADVAQRKSMFQGNHRVTQAFRRAEEDHITAGLVKGRVEVVEDFRRAGVSWDVIDAATGLVKAGFELVKAESLKPMDSLISLRPLERAKLPDSLSPSRSP